MSVGERYDLWTMLQSILGSGGDALLVMLTLPIRTDRSGPCALFPLCRIFSRCAARVAVNSYGPYVTNAPGVFFGGMIVSGIIVTDSSRYAVNIPVGIVGLARAMIFK